MPDFEKFRDDKKLRTAGPFAHESTAAPNPNASSAEKLIGETIDARYQLIAIIGEGGMGRVYKAKEILTGRVIALKMLPARNTSDMTHMMRFQQEAKAACAINHPNVVSVYEFGITPDGIPYIAMQFVEGVTLADEIAKSKRISESFALQIFEQIADALDCAHEHRVLHRDLKPSNIMLVPDKKFGRKAMLLDFGIAKLDDETQAQLNITKTGEIFGTPFYMSPEQCQGQKLDNRADIYSLGCVMYEALTGSPPFTGDNFLEILYRHAHENATAISSLSLNSNISSQLQFIVHKCLEKDLADRFQSVAELRSALQNVRPVESIRQPATKSGPRKAKPLLLAAIASLLGVVCASVYVYSIMTGTWIGAYNVAKNAMSVQHWNVAQQWLEKAGNLSQRESFSRDKLVGDIIKDGKYDREQATKLRVQMGNGPIGKNQKYDTLIKSAELLLQEGTLLSSGDHNIRLELARAYVEQSNGESPEQQLSLLKQAESCCPHSEQLEKRRVLYEYGKSLVMQGDGVPEKDESNGFYRHGIVVLEEAASMYANDAKSMKIFAYCHWYMATAHQRLGEYDLANEDFVIADNNWTDPTWKANFYRDWASNSRSFADQCKNNSDLDDANKYEQQAKNEERAEKEVAAEVKRTKEKAVQAERAEKEAQH